MKCAPTHLEITRELRRRKGAHWSRNISSQSKKARLRVNTSRIKQRLSKNQIITTGSKDAKRVKQVLVEAQVATPAKQIPTASNQQPNPDQRTRKTLIDLKTCRKVGYLLNKILKSPTWPSRTTPTRNFNPRRNPFGFAWTTLQEKAWSTRY